jgi:hypothetical protein
MNILFEYLYRDAGNFKKFGSVTFTNKDNIEAEYMADKIRSVLIDGRWFYAEKVGVPDLHFSEYDYDENLDVVWHEFFNCEATHDEPSDSYGRNIKEFFRSLEGSLPDAKS